jgi:protein O-GlcNAc transferase
VAQLESAKALFLEGLDLLVRQDYAGAERKLRQALELAPDRPSVLTNLSAALLRQDKIDEASRWARRSVELDGRNAPGWLNLAFCQRKEGRFAAALESCDRALAIRADYAEAWLGRGLALSALGRFEEALASYDQALETDAGSAEAWANRAVTLQDLKRPDEALASYDRSVALGPMPYAFGDRQRVRMELCRWEEFDATCARLTEAIEAGDRICSPFALLGLPSSPGLQRRCAEIYVLDRHPAAAPSPPVSRHPRRRLRIGYFSADFHNHATSYLMAGLFEHHDRSRFEVTAFSFGPPSSDAMRRRLQAAFEHFVDVRDRSDQEIASLSRELEIDIAVDLKGLTGYARPGIFAARAAPLQVNYLGYPGTMAAPYIDYLVADRTLIPEEHRVHYSEKVVWLPHSYQANDSLRKISGRVPQRREAGLPEGFVFCCFNNSAKITPGVFDIWMRLLRKLPGSALWLIERDTTAAANLRREAAARGVSPERLVFAAQLDLPGHLARHRLADLFLDTLHYNAHTTASDALWAGLPVVTCIGAAFAGRVGASLLNAIGLPELIARSPLEYEEIALSLATDPRRLRAIREKLAQNRATHPLFDTASFTRHIETAYAAMHERYQAGLPPDHIQVPA